MVDVRSRNVVGEGILPSEFGLTAIEDLPQQRQTTGDRHRTLIRLLVGSALVLSFVSTLLYLHGTYDSQSSITRTLNLSDEIQIILSQDLHRQSPPVNRTQPPQSVLQTEESPNPLYSVARYDRAGSFFHDMIMAYSYAFRHNRTYGGACPSKKSATFLENPNLYNQRLQFHQYLIDTLNLSDTFRIACPAQRSNQTVVQRKEYYHPSEALLPSAILQELYSKLPDRQTKTPSDTVLQVAVHIRRGDVTPCAYPDRYLPNVYYKRLIQDLFEENANVTIYSESSSFEGWQELEKSNLVLDSPVENVWQALMNADIVVTSKSSFSVVPALMNPSAKVYYYAGFWMTSPAHWIPVEQHHVQAAREGLRALQRQCQK